MVRLAAELGQLLAEDRQLLADGLAEHVGLAEAAREQALLLALVDEGIQLIVQGLVDLHGHADEGRLVGGLLRRRHG